jgi:hypothetical protein
LYQNNRTQYADKKVFIEDESFYWAPPLQKVTDQIILGGKIDMSSDVIIIQSPRNNKIDTTIWIVHERVGETEFWRKK